MLIHTYPIDQRPDVEAEVDGKWYPAELRQWTEVDGKRMCDVSWHRAVGETLLDKFPIERVRPC